MTYDDGNPFNGAASSDPGIAAFDKYVPMFLGALRAYLIWPSPIGIVWLGFRLNELSGLTAWTFVTLYQICVAAWCIAFFAFKRREIDAVLKAALDALGKHGKRALHCVVKWVESWVSARRANKAKVSAHGPNTPIGLYNSVRDLGPQPMAAWFNGPHKIQPPPRPVRAQSVMASKAPSPLSGLFRAVGNWLKAIGRVLGFVIGNPYLALCLVVLAIVLWASWNAGAIRDFFVNPFDIGKSKDDFREERDVAREDAATAEMGRRSAHVAIDQGIQYRDRVRIIERIVEREREHLQSGSYESDLAFLRAWRDGDGRLLDAASGAPG